LSANPAAVWFPFCLLFAVLIFINVAVADASRPGPGTLVVSTAKADHEFVVELVNTPSSRSRGLMYRRSMAGNAGMLFDFVISQRVVMWMKNTFIPLDMLFIDSEGKITNIASRTVPHSLLHIPSSGKVRAVLELNSGLAARLNISPGDRIRHKIFGDVRADK
jgi:uncharacterized protein